MLKRLMFRLVLLATALSLSLDVLPELVLCIGADGHYAIEPVRADCCDHDGAAAATTPARCAERCIDAPLGGTSISARGPEREGMPAPAVAATAGIAVVSPRLLSRPPRPALQAVPLRPPRVQRTTVFLC